MLTAVTNHMRLTTLLSLVILALLLSLSAVFTLVEKQLAQFNEFQEIDEQLHTASEAFRVQVQEWKNILLRGHEQEDYEKYLAAFVAREEFTQQSISRAITLAHASGMDTADLERFATMHDDLGRQYREALTHLSPTDPSSNRVVDGQVRGSDRPLFQHIAAFDEIVEDRLQEGYAALRQNARYLLVLLGIFITLAIGMVILGIRHPLRRLETTTARFSEGDLTARAGLSGSSELARLAIAFDNMADSLNDIVKDVHGSAIQLTGAATTVASTSREQEASATEQQASTVQISASAKEIAETASALLQSMDQVARVSDEATQNASEGKNGLAQMQETMNQMVASAKGVSSRLSELNDKASKITSVVTTINKIADQTNILSINAAIEADKAGEFGAGFGTVANEIRRLADQTAVATWDIEQMVQQIQNAVASGVMSTDKFSSGVDAGVKQINEVSRQFTQIIEQVQALGPHFESVYEGMQSQTTGAQQISEAIGQLSEGVRGARDSLRQSNTVIADLNSASKRLQSAVSRFRLSKEG